MADLIPVRDRLTRLQKDNYKSLPEKPFEKSVEQEIEELKQSEMIQPVSMAPKESIEVMNMEEKESAKEEENARHEERELLLQIEHKVSEIESIKAEMMKKGNFMQRMYDVKKIENDILPLLFDAKGRCIMIPDALRQRILMAAPKAAVLE